MGTQNRTQSTNQYNQGSMGVFNQLQSGIGANLQDFMNNPLQSSFFNTQLQMANRANQLRGSAMNQMLLQNSRTGGYNGNLPAFLQSQLARNQRQMSANQSNSFNNLLLGANQLRFGATQAAQGYHPLQTGQTQVQSQTGLGTWLPQVAGAAIGGLTMGLGGGMMGGGQSPGFFSGASSGPQGMSSGPFWGGSMGAGPAPNFGNPFMNQGYTPGGGIGPTSYGPSAFGM
jgi:hypothetical protein